MFLNEFRTISKTVLGDDTVGEVILHFVYMKNPVYFFNLDSYQEWLQISTLPR